jgi:putative polyketide hydroxylase
MIIWAKTLAGEEIERRVPWRAGQQAAAVSPVRNCLCAQDDLEPVLRSFAEQQEPGELKFSTEAIAFEQEADGVIVALFANSSILSHADNDGGDPGNFDVGNPS